MALTMKGFETLPELQSFEDRFFMVTLIYPDAHATVYVVGTEVYGRCIDLFPKYWKERNFIMGNMVYVYMWEDHATEDLYKKKWFMNFICDRGLSRGVVYLQMRLTRNIYSASLMFNC